MLWYKIKRTQTFQELLSNKMIAKNKDIRCFIWILLKPKNNIRIYMEYLYLNFY